MSRLLRTIVLVLVVSSCGGSLTTPPRNLDNACSMLAQRPQYHRAFQAAKRKWGVPIHVQMATIHQESKYRATARPPMRYVLGVIPRGRASSAYGYSQALDGTWDEYKRDSGRFGASRSNIRDSADFIGWYMTKTKRRTGVPLSDTRNQYLAYHEGQTGYLNGSYKSKSWLIKVADKVERRGETYKKQLQSCGRN